MSNTMSQTQKNPIGILTIGTLLEWAEFTFYGYMALTLSSLFFPSDHATLALFKTFGIFAVGFIMRPLGAILFGHLGDRYGRKPALVGAIALMGVATFAIGCLPTYAQIGSLAPILLLICRMLQGIAISGEYNGAGIYLVEKANNHLPCLAGSWISAAAAGGMVLGGIAAFIVSYPGMPVWAWRIPFLLGGFSCVAGFWIRKRLIDSTPSQPTRPTKDKLPLTTVFQKNRNGLLLTGAIAAFTGIFVYICNVYIVVFLHQTVGIPSHQAGFYAIFGEVLVAILIPCMGWLADYGCPYKQYQWGLWGVILFCPLIFMLCTTGTPWAILIAMALYGVLNATLCGPMAKMLTDQFPPHLRYTGISVGWSLSAAIFSGTAPIIATWLTSHWQLPLAPSFYVSAFALLTLLILQSCLKQSNPKSVLRWPSKNRPSITAPTP